MLCFFLVSFFFGRRSVGRRAASLTHYKLYLVSKVAAKIRGDDGLEPENFRGEGGPQTSKKKKKRCLNFSENEFEVPASWLIIGYWFFDLAAVFWLMMMAGGGSSMRWRFRGET